MVHLGQLGLTGLQVTPDPVLAATEGALLRVPTQSSRVFRLKPAIDSDGSQPPIPIEASHL